MLVPVRRWGHTKETGWWAASSASLTALAGPAWGWLVMETPDHWGSGPSVTGYSQGPPQMKDLKWDAPGIIKYKIPSLPQV